MKIPFGTNARVGVAVLALVSVCSSKAHAMGDFGIIVDGFWSDLVASYWWPNLDALNKDYYLRTYDEQVAAMLAGETIPIGLMKSQQSEAPPDPSNVTCSDFRVVRIDEISPTDSDSLPFRVKHPKSAVYFMLDGWLSNIGLPSQATFWVAAMLPDDSIPLFAESGLGINPDVLSHPLIVELGYSKGLDTMPATSITLQSVTNCKDFDIYHMEFKK